MYHAKTIIFAPKPDNFLMKDDYLFGYYKWVSGLKNAKYIDVIEGRYIGRPTDVSTQMDINNKKTYYKVEKGTDINLAIHALSMAYNNAYDVAFVLSADTDYINLYRHLKFVGKTVVAVAVNGQNLGKVIPEVDDYVVLDYDFFSCHKRETKADEQ